MDCPTPRAPLVPNYVRPTPHPHLKEDFIHIQLARNRCPSDCHPMALLIRFMVASRPQTPRCSQWYRLLRGGCGPCRGTLHYMSPLQGRWMGGYPFT